MAAFRYRFYSLALFSGTYGRFSLPVLLFSSVFGHVWPLFVTGFALSFCFRARMAAFRYRFCSFVLFSGTYGRFSLPVLLFRSVFGHVWPLFVTGFTHCSSTHSFYRKKGNGTIEINRIIGDFETFLEEGVGFWRDECEDGICLIFLESVAALFPFFRFPSPDFPTIVHPTQTFQRSLFFSLPNTERVAGIYYRPYNHV